MVCSLCLQRYDMPNCIRYTCQYELQPVLEAALAANGYHIDIPMQQSNGGTTMMVMTCGAASVLFTHPPKSQAVTIEIWGTAQAAAVQLLESLPINVAK